MERSGGRLPADSPGKASSSRKKQARQMRQDIDKSSKGAPAPSGVRVSMAWTGASDVKAAFAMLDTEHTGMLDAANSRRFLRCLGWCVSDEELDEMLLSCPVTARGGVSPARTMWGLKQLEEVLESHRGRQNSSVQALQEAIRLLANNRSQLSRDRLLQFAHPAYGLDLSEADIERVLVASSLENRKSLDCDTLATKILELICNPPSALDRIR
mmetsp:Transcript_51021/g.143617  ORF Transcript_51021/g.143617 Transcript_51021/m.143617 type:complete len:213 (+) Transcript_51021:110-748(+)